MKITDAKLVELAETVDSWILEFAESSKMPVFMLMSVILARLASLCRSLNMTDEFRSLLAHSIQSMDASDDTEDKIIH